MPAIVSVLPVFAIVGLAAGAGAFGLAAMPVMSVERRMYICRSGMIISISFFTGSFTIVIELPPGPDTSMRDTPSFRYSSVGTEPRGDLSVIVICPSKSCALAGRAATASASAAAAAARVVERTADIVGILGWGRESSEHSLAAESIRGLAHRRYTSRPRNAGRVRYSSTCVPSSTTRPVGMLKNSEGDLALRERKMKIAFRHRAIGLAPDGRIRSRPR